MATKNIVPRTGSEGEIGTSAKPWKTAHIDEVTASIGLSGTFLYGDGTSIINVPVDTLNEVVNAGDTTTNTINVGNLTSSAGVIAVGVHSTDVTASAGMVANYFVGALKGNADTATSATSATNADTVDTKHATDFTLDYVTSNGSTTANDITTGDISFGAATATINDSSANTRFRITSTATAVKDQTGFTHITAESSSLSGKQTTISPNGGSSAKIIVDENKINIPNAYLSVANMTASAGVVANYFIGDGTGITGVTGDWDGQHTGDAGITGSLAITGTISVSGSSKFGNLVTDNHIFTGSFHQTGSGTTSTFNDRIITSGSMKVTAPAGTSEVFRAEGTGGFVVNTDGNVDITAIGNDLTLDAGATATIKGSEVLLNTSGAPNNINAYGRLSASLGITASSFVGDGSGLTGVTGDWDGQHTGDAGITGSLAIQNSDGLTIKATAGAPTIGTFADPGDTSLTITANQFLNISSPNGIATTTFGDNKNTSRIFQIEGNSIAYDDIQLYLTPSTYSTHQRYLGIGYNNSTNTSVISAGKAGTGDNELAIWTSNSSSAEAERVRIDVSGNVGIGTTTPAHTLDVIGDIATQGTAGITIKGPSGATSGSLVPQASGGTTLGNSAADVGLLSYAGQAFVTSGPASLVVSPTDINLTTPAGKVAVAGVLSASLGITASSFVGDGSGLTNISFTETDTLATVTARGASTTTPVLFNTHITASTGISSGPLHVQGSSVHSGSFDIYDAGVTVFGPDGTTSGSFVPQASGGSTLGNTTADVGLLSYAGQAFVTSGPASLVVNPTDITLTPHSSGKVTVAGQLSASLGITGSTITADNAHITNLNVSVIKEPAGNIEGALAPGIVSIFNDLSVGINADPDVFVVDRSEAKVGVNYNIADLPAANFSVSGSTKLGELSTDTHEFTGSFLLRNPDETNAGLSIEASNTNHVTIKTTDATNGRINIGSGLNSTVLFNSKFAGSAYPFSGTSYEWGNASNPWGLVGTKQLSASIGIQTVTASVDLLTMDDTTAPPTPSNAAHMYAKSGEMFVMDTGGNETQISPHDEEGEWQYFSRNTITGKVVRIKMEKMIRKLEELTGETFIEEE